MIIPDRKTARANFDGTDRLFASCWKQYLQWLKGAIDSPADQADVDQWLCGIASEKVNNPRSTFHIYG